MVVPQWVVRNIIKKLVIHVETHQKGVVCGHCLVTLSLTINETLKRLSSLPILMQVILVVTV